MLVCVIRNIHNRVLVSPGGAPPAYRPHYVFPEPELTAYDDNSIRI